MKILVVYYSLYGHVRQLAQAVGEGSAGCRAPSWS
jgi:flavodoxin